MQDVAQTDGELIQRARQGDAGAFKAIVDRYEGRVAATVFGMLGNDPEVDDVGQETFIRLHQSLDAFRGDAGLGTYVTRIAINETLKLLRKRKTWRQRLFEWGEDALAQGGAVDAVRDYEERERAGQVQQALQALNPEHRAVVVLRLIQGYSTEETAQILKIAQGTVMSRLSRALAKLETMLSPLRQG